MLKKDSSFAGKNMPLPVVYEDSAGRSATFSTAQTNAGASKQIEFALDTVINYKVAEITTDALLRARSDKGSFIRGLELMMDTSINSLANDLERSLFRDGSGQLGNIGTATDNPIVLADPDDVVNFYVGQKLVFAADSSSALGSSTAISVTAVDRDAGTVTCSAAPSTQSASDADAIFEEGDYVSASDKNKITGLAGWIPSTAPATGGSDSHFGVDRSVDPTRLAGIRYTGNSAAIEESIVGAAARLGRESGARPDTALMNYSTFRRLVNELGSKVQRDQGGKAVGGFNMLEIIGPRGPIKCVPCSFCQSSLVWLLTLDSWALYSMEDPIRVLDDDGLRVSRRESSDALEVRIGSYAQLGCVAPGKNARISL